MFGDGYVKGINDLIQINKQLGEVNISNMMYNTESALKGPVQQHLGQTGASIVSVARDRIASNMHKILIIGSRLNIARADKKKLDMMYDFMSNPDVVKEMSRISEAGKLNVPWKKAFGDAGSVISRSIIVGSHTGAKVAAESGAAQEQLGVQQ